MRDHIVDLLIGEVGNRDFAVFREGPHLCAALAMLDDVPQESVAHAIEERGAPNAGSIRGLLISRPGAPVTSGANGVVEFCPTCGITLQR